MSRAVAVCEVHGPDVALGVVDALDAHRHHLDGYYLFHAIRADFLRRLGRNTEAASAYARAISCNMNTAEQDFLQSRVDELHQL